MKESKLILDELDSLVELLELAHEEFPSDVLSDFSQRIDRIMGAAKTMSLVVPPESSFGQGLATIGRLAQTCKTIGYQAAEKRIVRLLPFFAAFWSDTIEVMRNQLQALGNSEKTSQIANSFPAVLQGRLEWLATRVTTDESSSAKTGKSGNSP